MRILIVGAGAVGGWLAGVLSRGGAEVALLARGAPLQAIRADGLTLVDGERREVAALEGEAHGPRGRVVDQHAVRRQRRGAQEVEDAAGGALLVGERRGHHHRQVQATG